jgi:hypothetical protein
MRPLPRSVRRAGFNIRSSSEDPIAKVRWTFAGSDCRRAQARRQGAIRKPDASNPAAPAWAGAETRLPGGEGRPDDLPVADRQARTHCAQAQGRVAGADGFDACQIRQGKGAAPESLNPQRTPSPRTRKVSGNAALVPDRAIAFRASAAPPGGSRWCRSRPSAGRQSAGTIPARLDHRWRQLRTAAHSLM